MKILIILLILTIALPLFAENPVIKVNVSDVHPTQMEIGEDRVNAKITEYYQKWLKKYPKKEKTFEQYIATELVPKKKFPAVLGPDGEVYILDGHHRTTTFLRILSRRPKLLKKTTYEVEVIADYSNKTIDEFAHGLIVEMGKGYFPKKIRKKDFVPAELVDLLPNSPADLVDNPMRSLIGKIFDDLDLETDYMMDYIQFYIGEFVEDSNIEIDYDNLLSEENSNKVKEAIFTKRKIVDFLLDNPRSEEFRELNNKQIAQVINDILSKKERRRLVRGKFKTSSCLVTVKLLLR